MVKEHQKISDTEGGFTGTLDNFDQFGSSVASLGDLNQDGVGDIVVGAHLDGGGVDLERGAVWILFLNNDGTVKNHQKISDTEGGFNGILGDFDQFGTSVTSLGDLDSDDVGDIAVGAIWDDDGGGNRGAVWILFLNTDGTVKNHQKISDTEGGFNGTLDVFDNFGVSVTSLGDLNGDGVSDITVGAHTDDDGGLNHGAVWVLFLDGPPIFTVNTTDDLDDGSCTVAHCSLREAVALISDGGRITFAPSLDGQTITLSEILLLTDKWVVIDTEGQDITIE